MRLRATPSSVVVYADDEAVARHDRHGAGLRGTLERHLSEERAPLRHRSRAYWEQRADQIGQDVGRFVRELFGADDVLSQLRKVQAIVTHLIVTHLEKLPQERAQAACRRASHCGPLSYHGVRDILRRRLDFELSPQSAAEPAERCAGGVGGCASTDRARHPAARGLAAVVGRRGP
ncbi:hypothetical protein WMF20_31950 [Sorangium sp. So ce834]|uniref:hypothetical protein n=1 Tax=Sorangium sp. So ce834 TaxID=3133321 RepID=UPI003F63FEEA